VNCVFFSDVQAALLLWVNAWVALFGLTAALWVIRAG
jgi:hypothetical protein